jgi:hypothetical protein
MSREDCANYDEVRPPARPAPSCAAAGPARPCGRPRGHGPALWGAAEAAARALPAAQVRQQIAEKLTSLRDTPNR